MDGWMEWIGLGLDGLVEWIGWMDGLVEWIGWMDWWNGLDFYFRDLQTIFVCMQSFYNL